MAHFILGVNMCKVVIEDLDCKDSVVEVVGVNLSYCLALHLVGLTAVEGLPHVVALDILHWLHALCNYGRAIGLDEEPYDKRISELEKIIIAAVCEIKTLEFQNER